MCQTTKKASEIYIAVRSDDKTTLIPVSELLRLTNLGPNASEIALVVEQAGTKLCAAASVGERECPNIMVDAVDSYGEDLYLANVQLPNEEYPSQITARLYAGYAKFETDQPIALVSTTLKDWQELAEAEYEIEKKQFVPKTRLVGINHDFAAPVSDRHWNGHDYAE